MTYFKPDHEIHGRRFSRNLWVGLALAGFVGLSFLLTVEKVTQGNPMKAIRGQGHAVTPEDQALIDAYEANKAAKTGAGN